MIDIRAIVDAEPPLNRLRLNPIQPAICVVLLIGAGKCPITALANLQNVQRSEFCWAGWRNDWQGRDHRPAARRGQHRVSQPGECAEREWKDTAAMIANERFENRHARRRRGMGKVDDAKREYTKAYDRIVKLAGPITAWRAEMQAAEREAVQLADQRIKALTRDDVTTADQLHAQIKAKQSRAADLRAMISKREGEIGAAVSALYDGESRAVMQAKIKAAAIEKGQARDEIGALAPAWNRAQARYTRAQQIESSLTYLETEFQDQRNRAAFFGSVLFQLLGTGENSEYKPSWLMN